MSTEHETVMAKMAILQGTIDQRKRTLGSSTAALNANALPRSSSMSFFASYPAQHHPSQTQLNPAPSQNLPVVTKTTWQSSAAPNRQPMTHPNLRLQPRGLTKLILNQPSPSRAVPIKPPPTSASIPSIRLTPSSSSPSLPPNQPFKPTLTATPGQTSQSNPLQNITTTSPSNNPAASLPPVSSLKPTTPPLLSSLTNKTTTSPEPISLPLPPRPTPTPVLLPARPTNPNELVIGGVSFVRDTQGKKLVRKTEQSSSSQPAKPIAPLSNLNDLSKNEEKKLTPIKALVGGMTYIRTKSGNLVELNAMQKFQSQKIQEIKKAKLLNTVNAMKSRYSKPTKVTRTPLVKQNKQCQFFAKTGACRNGLTCVFQHDPLQVAICPRFLRRRCPHSASSCPLSHVPNAHNMEHCSHFPRCNKPECPYPHVQPTTSQICQEFADLGWCSKGAQCTDRHVRECPEFSTKGTCSNVSCRLRHIINRNSNDNEENQAADPGPSDEDGVGLFFTDLTGIDQGGGKRKTNPSTSNTRIQTPHHPPTKGISHNCDRPVKRTKYDAMADNDDYVMFISSDEEEDEEASTRSEKSEAEDEPPSSVDSREQETPLDRIPDKSEAPVVSSSLPPPHTRLRSRHCSEEMEEGEILEDYDEQDDEMSNNHGTELVSDCQHSLSDDDDDDDDEMVARQLVGDRLRSLAL